ncbi:MAG: O-antigen ligase family protein [Bacteroidota bacterium]
MQGVTATLHPERIEAPVLLVKPCMMLCGILAVLKVVPVLVSVVMLGLAIYAWRGAKESIQALSVMFLLLNLNPAVFYFWGQGASLRWLILGSAFGRLVADAILSNRKWPFKVNMQLLLYAAVIVILSAISSRLPAISIFKAVAFFMGAVTILTGFYRTRDEQAYWFSWFFSVFVLMLCLSLPLYFSAAGFFTNGRGFQGILNHPQTLGPVTAPLTAALTMWVFRSERQSIIHLAVLCAGLFVIYASQSRTALLMYTASLLVAGVVVWMRRRAPVRRKKPLFPVAVKLLGVLTMALLLVSQGRVIDDKVQQFLLKKSETEESLSFQVRSSMVARQMANFETQPLTGIGFGVPSSVDDWVSLSTGFLGIPTGFPVEKGFLPSAVLEETGLIGASLLIVLLFTLVGPVLKKATAPYLAILLACMLANTGEMVFFSFGGAGLYYWLLIGLSYNSVIPCVE